MTNPLREAARDVASSTDAWMADDALQMSLITQAVLRRYATCPTCNGHRDIYETPYGLTAGTDGPCPGCDGTGWNPQRVKLDAHGPDRPFPHVTIVIPVDHLETPNPSDPPATTACIPRDTEDDGWSEWVEARTAAVPSPSLGPLAIRYGGDE